MLFKAPDPRLGLIPRLASALVVDRQRGKVSHALADLLGQHSYGLALGYEDVNDAARLADDPIHELLLGRDPVTGEALASQPTLSRFDRRTPLINFKVRAGLHRILVFVGRKMVNETAQMDSGVTVVKSYDAGGVDRGCLNSVVHSADIAGCGQFRKRQM